MTDIERGGLWEQFVGGLPDTAMLLLDPEGKILGWNAGAEALLGYAAGEVIGRNFACLYNAEDSTDGHPAMALQRAVDGGRAEETGPRIRQDGTQIETRDLLMPLHDAQKVHVGFGSLMRQVTPDSRAVGVVVNLATPNVIPLRAHKKILVVDDNAEILETLGRQLTNLGYAVALAADGAEALDILGRIADVDLLLTDVIMPGGMNGRQLAEHALLRNRDLPILLTSGHADEPTIHALCRSGRAAFLGKPYRRGDLARAIGETFANQPTAATRATG